MKQLLMPSPLVAMAIAAVAIVFAVGGYRIGLWETDMPGAGLLPFAAALLLFFLIIRVFFERPADETAFSARPFAAVALLGCYAAVLPMAGFIIPTVILIVLWAMLLEGQSLLVATIVGTVLTLAGSAIFVKLLQVPMPLLPKVL